MARAGAADERADVGRGVHRVADAERRHRRDEVGLELVGDGVVDDEALRRDTALPVVQAAGRRRDLGSLLERCRRQHEEGVAAAELEHGRLDLGAGDGPDRPPGGHAPGERRGPHPRVAQHALDLVDLDQERLEGAVGEARVGEEPLQVRAPFGARSARASAGRRCRP